MHHKDHAQEVRVLVAPLLTGSQWVAPLISYNLSLRTKREPTQTTFKESEAQGLQIQDRLESLADVPLQEIVMQVEVATLGL